MSAISFSDENPSAVAITFPRYVPAFAVGLTNEIYACFTVPAGTQLRLCPGESICVHQRMYHDFEVEAGTGPVLLGEVSQCNDDNTDNRFNPPVGRFPAIEEDEPPYRLLCNEYPKANE